MLLSMAPLHLLGHIDQNEVKHDSLHLIPFAPVLVSHGANGNKMTSFFSLGQNN